MDSPPVPVPGHLRMFGDTKKADICPLFQIHHHSFGFSNGGLNKYRTRWKKFSVPVPPPPVHTRINPSLARLISAMSASANDENKACALDAKGQLLQASKIDFFHSPSSKVPLARVPPDSPTPAPRSPPSSSDPKQAAPDGSTNGRRSERHHPVNSNYAKRR